MSTEIEKLVLNETEAFLKEFEAFKDDYSSDKSKGSPLFYPGDRQTCILLLHGYLSSPYQMKNIAERLNVIGYPVVLLRIPGHGSNPVHLQEYSLAQWREKINVHYDIISRSYKNIVLVGFSAGALLSLDCATRVKPSAVVSISAPIFFCDRKIIFASALNLFSRILFRFFGVTRFSYLNHDPEDPSINYRRNYVYSLSIVVRLAKYVRKCCSLISSPTLLIQGDRDPVVRLESVDFLFDHVKNATKKKYIISSDKHGIVLNNSEEISTYIKDFIDEYCAD